MLVSVSGTYLYLFICSREADENVFAVSLATGEGLERLQREIEKRLMGNINYLQKKVRIPMTGSHLR